MPGCTRNKENKKSLQNPVLRAGLHWGGNIMDTILEMRGIRKAFPGVKALDNVNLRVRRGDIHAIVGENGAGKSTLMKVLSGVYPHGTYSGERSEERRVGKEC